MAWHGMAIYARGALRCIGHMAIMPSHRVQAWQMRNDSAIFMQELITPAENSVYYAVNMHCWKYRSFPFLDHGRSVS